MADIDPHPGRESPTHIGDSSPLEVARVRAVYVFMGLITFLVITTATGLTPHIDVAFFGTLVGALIALLGLGSVVRLVVSGRTGASGDDQK